MTRADPGRRFFLRSAGALLLTLAEASRRFTSATAASFDPCEKSIGDLQAALRAGLLTSADLVRFYLDRIAAYDQAGPRLNAVLYVNPHAAAEARSLDAERRRHGPRGPLHGIPVLLKDNFETKDMPTTGGSLALSGIVPRTMRFKCASCAAPGSSSSGK